VHITYWTDPKRKSRRPRQAVIPSPFAAETPIIRATFHDVDVTFDDGEVVVAPGIRVMRSGLATDPSREICSAVAPILAAEMESEREF
jgi:hypothetical protein